MIVRDNRKLATVRRISALEPIPGADRIEVARVDGWNVVVRKGEFRVGQQVVYFEIDTCLPVNWPQFSFLKERGVKDTEEGPMHVLKTVRLKGVYSQGLILDLGDFLSEGRRISQDGVDLTGELALGKWEKPIPLSMGGQTAGKFPLDMTPKTDSERIQNLSDKDWAEIQSHDWIATLKVDGTSCTALMRPDGEVVVASRNWSIKDGDNLYWRTARESGILDALTRGLVIQFEIAGPGVQGNPYKLDRVRPFIFSVMRDGRPFGRRLWRHDPELRLAAPLLPLELPATREEAIEQANGLTTDIGGATVAAEGIVWHTVDGEAPKCLGRPTFKVVSNKYLLKQKD